MMSTIGISIDSEVGELVFTPVQDGKRRSARFTYPRFVRLPFKMKLSLSHFEQGVLAMPFNLPTGQLVLNVYAKSAQFPDGSVSVGWRDLVNGEWQGFDNFVKYTHTKNTQTKTAFELPFNGSESMQRLWFNVGYSGRETLSASRLDVTAGHIVPAIGVGFGEKDGHPFVETLLKGAGAKAGLRVDDVVTLLNDNRMLHAQDLVSRLSMLRIGESAELSVLRKGRTKKITIVGE